MATRRMDCSLPAGRSQDPGSVFVMCFPAARVPDTARQPAGRRLLLILSDERTMFEIVSIAARRP